MKNQKTKFHQKARALACCIFLSVIGSTVFAQSRPNIIFILADDLGYGDISALNQNSKIKTPNIDKIQQSGIAFTDAHGSAAVCTPTRYGILTGRYNWRSTLKKSVLIPFGKPLIQAGRTTMASMLKQQGYTTSCMGKWHLGFNWATKDGRMPSDRKPIRNLNYQAPITGGLRLLFWGRLPKLSAICFYRKRPPYCLTGYFL